tara:strand:- start:6765 stop:7796 length:1032 start_codon:yes stop_codon:yes gene_type:complete
MASTFVNNLRLEEMATGEQSGNWGTKTNTNLELIGEALGFGTEGITTNANTHTTTIADGASDAGRALFLKYTGALDSDCTITIGPNTMKRVHIIENATTDSGSSGPYNIIISQGSGANVTIGNGDTKVVYLDGAGSGAAVVDAFVDLDLSGGSVNVSTVKTNSGDMTFDSAGDIVLDADGADLIFKDGGTTIAKFINSSSDFVIATDVDDKDFIIKGQDSTSEITALTIDMSAAGAATFNNDVTAFSDERLKENIQPITGGLEKVMQLQGVTYKRNDVTDAKTQIGVIAQQVEPILPEVVLTAEDEMGTKSVDYAKMTAVLIEAVKELKQEITQLKQQINNGA